MEVDPFLPAGAGEKIRREWGDSLDDLTRQ
jgi:hypothetical protein